MPPQGYPLFEAPPGYLNGVTGVTTFQPSTFSLGHGFYAPSTPIADPGVVADPAWFIDSGATNHVTKDIGIFFYCSVFIGNDKLHIGNGMGLDIHHVGSVLLSTISATPLYLNNVLHVPAITKNLLSVSKLLVDNNVLIEFHSTTCFVKAKTSGTILPKGIVRGGLYQVQSFIAIYNPEVSSSPSN